MRKLRPSAKTKALTAAAHAVFGDAQFTQVKTGVGIVATRWQMGKPMIFKASVGQAHGRHATFQPGFGVSIADAVRASCSAYPFFKKATLKLHDGSSVVLIDGGYCANNPALYALADGIAALKRSPTDIRLLTIGVGHYPEPRDVKWVVKSLWFSLRLLQKTLDVNTQSMEQLRAILYRDVPTVRISDTFDRPDMATDLMESNLQKLNLLYQEGAESFARREEDIKRLLDLLPVTQMTEKGQ
jgi:uncharacterized protein